MTGAPTRGAGVDSLTSLLSDRPRRTFSRGARLYREGESPTCAFIVHAGLVKMVKTTRDGTEALVDFRGPASFVGEHSAIDGMPRTTTAIAATDSSATRVPRADFVRHIRQDAEFAMTVVSSLSDVVRTNIGHTLDLMVGDAVALVAARLLQLAHDPIFEAVRDRRDGTIVIEMPLSQRELASWSGVSQRSATGALGYFRDRGAISTSRLHIEVRDPAALAEHRVARSPIPGGPHA